MTQSTLNQKEQYNRVKGWIQKNGIYNVMRNSAHHLLPYIDFNYRLNIGGGSYTDGKQVVVGIPEHTWGMTFEEILSVTSALTGHEAEHVWSSDFKVFQKFQTDVQKYFQDTFNKRVPKQLGANMLNITEDGRIEKRLVNRYPGYLKHIQFLRASFWNLYPVNGENELADFMQSLISLSTMGIKAKDWDAHYTGAKADEMLDLVRPLIINAINNPTAKGCADDTLQIVKALGEYFDELLQNDENQEQLESMDDQPDYTSSAPKEDDDSQPGNSVSSHFVPEQNEASEESEEEDGEGDGSGKTESSEQDDTDEESSSNGSSSKEDGDDEAKDDEVSEGSGQSSENDSKDEEGLEGKDSSDGSDSEDEAEENKDETDGENPSGDLNDSQSDSASKSESNYTTEEMEQLIESIMANQKDAINESGQSLMKEAEMEMRREEALYKKENEYKGHLSEKEMREVDPSVTLNNRNPVETRNSAVPSDVMENGRYLNKKLQKILLNKKTYTSKHRRSGRLDTSTLWKMNVKDHNVFLRKGVPTDRSIAINLLVDYSGSMTSYMDTQYRKIDYAVRAVATIEEGLRDIVPHRITFFSGTGNYVHHSTVKDFNQESKDTLSWKRKPNIPMSANRDGYSIKVATAELLKRNERRKFLIVLSDGRPTEPNEIAGQREVKEAVRMAREKGIIVIVIGFGSEKEMTRNRPVYEEMYGKGIIMVPPSEIHIVLAKLIENEMSR